MCMSCFPSANFFAIIVHSQSVILRAFHMISKLPQLSDASTLAHFEFIPLAPLGAEGGAKHRMRGRQNNLRGNSRYPLCEKHRS